MPYRNRRSDNNCRSARASTRSRTAGGGYGHRLGSIGLGDGFYRSVVHRKLKSTAVKRHLGTGQRNLNDLTGLQRDIGRSADRQTRILGPILILNGEIPRIAQVDARRLGTHDTRQGHGCDLGRHIGSRRRRIHGDEQSTDGSDVGFGKGRTGRRLTNGDADLDGNLHVENHAHGGEDGGSRTLLDFGRHGVDGEDERGGTGLTGSDVGNAPILVGLESQRPRTGRNDRNSLGLAARGGDAYRRGLLVVDRDGDVHIAALVVVGAGAESSRSQRREEQRTPKIQTFHKKRF